MVSIVPIVLSMRWMTEREFRTYLFDQNQNNIVTTLADFYGENGTWNGVEESLLYRWNCCLRRNQGGRWFFTLWTAAAGCWQGRDQVGALISSGYCGRTPLK
jgi:hypothetical protein